MKQTLHVKSPSKNTLLIAFPPSAPGARTTVNNPRNPPERSSCSLAPLFDDVNAVLFILLLRDPQLMETTQTSQNASAYPSSILALDDRTRCDQLVPSGWIQAINLGIQAIIELVEKRRTARDNDVAEKHGALIGIDILYRCLNQFWDGLLVLWTGVIGILAAR